MTLELISAIAAVGTFLVIAATAAAAVVQLHHLRGGNQIIALNEIREVIESEKFVKARHFIADELAALLAEPGMKEALAKPVMDRRLEQASYVGNVFEGLGTFVKYRIIDADIACDVWGGVILSTWNLLLELTKERRRRAAGFQASFENFEYLAVLCEDFNARNPDGAYPKAVRRMPVDDV